MRLQAHLAHSRNLMRIILKKSTEEYEKVREERDLLRSELQTRLTENQYLQFNKRLEKKLIPIQNDTKERKRDKFLRDKMDFDLDRTFNWNKNKQESKRWQPHKNNNKKRNTKWRRPNDHWTTDSGSDSSLSEDQRNMDPEKGKNQKDSSAHPLGLEPEGDAQKRNNPDSRGGTKRKQVSWRR